MPVSVWLVLAFSLVVACSYIRDFSPKQICCVVALGMAVLKLAAAKFRRKRACKSVEPPSNFGGATGLLRPFPLSQASTPSLRVKDEQLSWFVGEVARIHAVELGECPGPAESSRRATTSRLHESISAALMDLRAEVVRINSSDPFLHEPLDDALLGRLLVACDFCVAKAAYLVRQYVSFREGMGGGVPPPLDTLRAGAFLVPFMDNRGRPVLLVRGRFFDASTDVGEVQRCFRSLMDVVVLELVARRTGSHNISPKNPLEQYVCVIETEGCGWSNMSMPVLKMLVRETNVFFPDRLQEIIVLGAAASIRAIWRLASPLVHPRTQRKVQLVGRHDVKKVMQRLVPLSQLPPEYGGEGAPLADPSEGGDIESCAGAIAASAWRRASLQVDTANSETSDRSRPGSVSSRHQSRSCNGFFMSAPDLLAKALGGWSCCGGPVSRAC